MNAKAKESIKAIKSNYPPEKYTMLREALDTAIAVLSCFDEGDGRCLKAIVGTMQAITGPETTSDEMAFLHRLQGAVGILEAEK